MKLLTIKSRLFLSNFIMVIVLVAAIMANMLLDRSGVYNPYNYDPYLKNTQLFYRTISYIWKNSDRWAAAGDLEQIIQGIERSGEFFEDTALSLAIYHGKDNLYSIGEFKENVLFDTAVKQPKEQHFTMDHTALYAATLGDYRLYLHNSAHEYGESHIVEGRGTPFPVGVFIIILIVLLTNRFLNKKIIKSIVAPLYILVDGVHEIRDGNLDYRIEYRGKDEFSSVCEDFNEMARQIQQLMEARRKDDENRRELIAGISHDLRTPLTSIKAYAEGLMKGVASTPQMERDYLQTVSDKAEDLEHIVNQLFLFSKLDIGEFPFAVETVNMGDLLRQYRSNVAGEYEKRGLQVLLDDIAADIMVRVDPVQIRNVFTNILENALKYGDPLQGKIRIGAVLRDGNVDITFQDNGPGVTEERLDKLFNAFYRTDSARRNPGQGSGLGLAISHIIIERLGGAIYAKNAAEGGLKLIITLPLERRPQ